MLKAVYRKLAGHSCTKCCSYTYCDLVVSELSFAGRCQFVLNFWICQFVTRWKCQTLFAKQSAVTRVWNRVKPEVMGVICMCFCALFLHKYGTHVLLQRVFHCKGKYISSAHIYIFLYSFGMQIKAPIKAMLLMYAASFLTNFIHPVCQVRADDAALSSPETESVPQLFGVWGTELVI